MSRVLGVLLAAVLVLVYCTSCSTGPAASIVRKLKSRFTKNSECGCSGDAKSATSEGMTVKESTSVLSKLDNIFSKEDTVGNNRAAYSEGGEDHYDPIQMGALKKTEIDAHKRGLAEMTPFNSYGIAGASKVLRDDREIDRNGVPWVGGVPRMKLPSGPQAGARQVPSASDKDIYQTYYISSNASKSGL